MKLKDCISELKNISLYKKEKLFNSNPKQWINQEIKFPVWVINYSYVTNRGNPKQHSKYFIGGEDEWDLLENVFNQEIQNFNERNPERAISNVQILEMTFAGEYIIPLE